MQGGVLRYEGGVDYANEAFVGPGNESSASKRAHDRIQANKQQRNNKERQQVVADKCCAQSRLLLRAGIEFADLYCELVVHDDDFAARD